MFFKSLNNMSFRSLIFFYPSPQRQNCLCAVTWTSIVFLSCHSLLILQTLLIFIPFIIIHSINFFAMLMLLAIYLLSLRHLLTMLLMRTMSCSFQKIYLFLWWGSVIQGVWSASFKCRRFSWFIHRVLSSFETAVEAAESINSRFGQFFCENEPFCKIDFCEQENEAPVICKKSLVYFLLSNLKTEKAMGSDMIPPILLKSSASELYSPLCDIFNLSFMHASVPTLWKIADTCPLPKKFPC